MSLRLTQFLYTLGSRVSQAFFCTTVITVRTKTVIPGMHEWDKTGVILAEVVWERVLSSGPSFISSSKNMGKATVSPQ